MHLTKLRSRVQRMELPPADDLLAYSRGPPAMRPGTAGCRGVDQNVIALLAPPTGFTVNVTGDLPTSTTPRVPLQIVLRNLIGNAFKHHHQPHTGEVHIHAQVVEEMVEFQISDNGPGTRSQFHERIFGVFQTLQPCHLGRGQRYGAGAGNSRILSGDDQRCIRHRRRRNVLLYLAAAAVYLETVYGTMPDSGEERCAEAVTKSRCQAFMPLVSTVLRNMRSSFSGFPAGRTLAAVAC